MTQSVKVIKVPRPDVLGGITVKVPTGCGNMYVQMNWHNGSLFEVFATLGKTGGCASCQSEGITRNITVGLRSGVSVNEYIKQLAGLRCPTPLPFPKESAVWSCPDAISSTLRQYGTMSHQELLELLHKLVNTEGTKIQESDNEDIIAATELKRLQNERKELESDEDK